MSSFARLKLTAPHAVGTGPRVEHGAAFRRGDEEPG